METDKTCKVASKMGSRLPLYSVRKAIDAAANVCVRSSTGGGNRSHYIGITVSHAAVVVLAEAWIGVSVSVCLSRSCLLQMSSSR